MVKKNSTRIQNAKQAQISKHTQQTTITRQRLLKIGVPALLLIVGVIGLTTVFGARKPINPPSLEDFPSQGQTHIDEGASHPAYNSNPPTSGWHYAAPADWGIYQDTIPDEVLVHNLEHGGIWLSYRDKDDSQTIQQLTDIARRYPNHVILTYRPADDRPIAVAAWGHLLKLDAVDNTAILDFITRYIRKGPEDA